MIQTGPSAKSNMQDFVNITEKADRAFTKHELPFFRRRCIVTES